MVQPVSGSPRNELERIVVDDERSARGEAALRNSGERDWRWSHWWAQPARMSARWAVMRVRMVGPDEVDLSPREFEKLVRAGFGEDPNRMYDFPGAAFTGRTGLQPYWEGVAGLQIESVELQGDCPDTELVVTFGLIERRELLFGERWRIWSRAWLHEIRTAEIAASERSGYSEGADDRARAAFNG